MAVFRGSIAAGVGIVDTDAVLTHDDRIVLNYDLKSGERSIRLYHFVTLNLPALENFFVLIKDKPIQVMLETKMARDGDAIRRYLNSRIRLQDYVQPAKALGAAIQFINFRIIERKDVHDLHAAAIQVFSGTTSDPAEGKKPIAIGVDGILAADPLGLQKLLPGKRY